MNVRFPLNKGISHNIPPNAVLHESLCWRLRNDPSYHPTNNHGELLPPCLKHEGRVADVTPFTEENEPQDPDHQTYKLAKPITRIDS